MIYKFVRLALAIYAHKALILAAAASLVVASSAVIRAAEKLAEQFRDIAGSLAGSFPEAASAQTFLAWLCASLNTLADKIDAFGRRPMLHAVALTPKRLFPAVKLTLVLVILGLVMPNAARAQGFDFSAGPSVPFLEYDFSNPHPVSIAPGAGVQVSVTHDNFKRAFLGKSWDLIDLDLMAFGSEVSATGGQQFGELSAAAALCTFSSLVCVGAGKHLLDTGHVFHSGGWFAVISFSFNFALAPTSPPVGLERGAAGLPRANTIYLGAP